jgi:hypothetical protein
MKIYLQKNKNITETRRRKKEERRLYRLWSERKEREREIERENYL